MQRRRLRWRGAGGSPARQVQIRLPLEPCLLLLLHQGKSHGYELAQELSPFGLGELDPSLVYRMLRGLEASGWVVSEWDAEAEAGMPRRVYRLTAQGDEHLSRWVQELGATDEFLHYFLDAYKRHVREDEGQHS